MEQFTQIVNQIYELSGVLLEALQQAGGAGGLRQAPEGGAPEGAPAGPGGEQPPQEG